MAARRTGAVDLQSYDFFLLLRHGALHADSGGAHAAAALPEPDALHGGAAAGSRAAAGGG